MFSPSQQLLKAPLALKLVQVFPNTRAHTTRKTTVWRILLIAFHAPRVFDRVVVGECEGFDIVRFTGTNLRDICYAFFQPLDPHIFGSV